MPAERPGDIIGDVTEGEYKYGFVTDVETDVIPVGLSEEVVRLISQKKNEPEWLLEFRLKAYRHWLTLTLRSGGICVCPTSISRP